MNRLFLAAVVAAFAANGAGAMHSPMMSTQYFPLIDGARYEYVFTSGPRASAVAVMHAGQTWAGATQLTSFHMTATCRTGTSCVQDTTDFFRMDPDGMRYFGGDGRTADHVNYMTTLMNPEWLIKNPVAPGTMMGPGMGYQDIDGWQAAVSGMHSVMGSQQHTSSYQALALETVTTPAGTFANSLHVREQRGPGNVRDVWYAPGVGMVRWIDGPEEALLASLIQPTVPVAPVARAVEFYHAGLDHYFMTAEPAEIEALDVGRLQGWRRTGLSFNVVAGPAETAAGTAAVCRYYGRPDAGLDTHFYSASADECAAVGRNWPDRWMLESSNVFRVYMPDTTTGRCPAGTLPIYRAWNQRADVNHRFTMDPNVQQTMMGRGHAAEGYGDPPVAMCSPL
jgi:hypothetical protein